MNSADQINILVVDDLPEKLVAIEAILEELGQNVVSVRSGREALRRLLHQDFALILLDVNMPEMDGFETAALIRQRKKSEHTPIIFITGFSDDTHVSRGYSLGAVDYIFTPVVPEVLRAKVAVFVDLFRKTELVKRQAEQQVAIVREQAARAAAEAATQRSAFLADASTLLATSLDFEATITCSARLPVPALADICVLRLDGNGRRGEAPRVAYANRQFEALLLPAPDYPLGPGLDACSISVIRSGKMKCLKLGDFNDSLLCRDAEADPIRMSRDLSAALVLPLVVRGKVLGAMTLAKGSMGNIFSPLDISLAEDLAGRIAIAIDNANLFRRIQEGDRRKDEFLATLSHELRNPLAAISNAAQCLEAAADSPAIVNEARTILNRQIRHVVRLVDDLLDVSRITRGKIRLRKERVDLRTIVERAVSGVQSLVADRRQELKVVLPETTIPLNGDLTRLEQVVGNLLNNAAKYTDPGGKIGLIGEVEGNQVLIRVKDTGAGIPAEVLPKIFDLFAQGDWTLNHSQGGLGIGLTLVRSLVALHGGEVEASSPGLGQGSEFIVRLPIAAQLSEPVTTPAPPTDNSALDQSTYQIPRKLLLVDDNLDLAKVTAALLQAQGHEVHLRHDGPQALSAVESLQPDVVFIDIGLPGMSGHEVARAIRRLNGCEDIFLVAVTGFGQAEDRRRSLDAGFDVHLVKPVGIQTLLDLLRSPRAEQPQPIGGAR